jgi:hypothetical protein
VYAATEIETLMPEIKMGVKSMYTRSSSQRSLGADAESEALGRGRGGRSSKAAAQAPPQREGRMSTRGRVVVPAWQRSDVYEMDIAVSDSDEEDDTAQQIENKNKLNALEFLKRFIACC